VRVALRDLDLAQVEESDSVWVQEQEQVVAQAEVQAVAEVEVQEQAQGWVEAKARESALPQGYRLDSEEGLVRDSVQVTELELG
jgi:chorismate-pyruvate lyase